LEGVETAEEQAVRTIRNRANTGKTPRADMRLLCNSTETVQGIVEVRGVEH